MMANHSGSKNSTKESILRSWIAVEALSASSTFEDIKDYGKSHGLLNPKLLGTDFILPWLRKKSQAEIQWEEKQKKEKYPKEKVYALAFSQFDYTLANSRLEEIYQPSYKDRPRKEKKKIGITSGIMINSKGCPITGSTAVSSYPWAYHNALNKKLKNMSEWPLVQESIVFSIRNAFKDNNENGTRIIDGKFINDLRKIFKKMLCIEKEISIEQAYLFEKIVYAVDVDDQKFPIINSFFIEDLNDQIWSNSPQTDRYLGVTKANHKVDLLNNRREITKYLSPSCFPLSGWPHKHCHRLVFNQQVAINVALTSHKDESMFAINGPPGNGKTTALKDGAAAILFAKAKAMCEFSDPRKAFTEVEKVPIAQSSAQFTFFKLDSSLLGHEIIVGANGNKAVENITKELVKTDEVNAKDYPDLEYFSFLSNKLLEEESTPTWGLISAALGNNDNVRKFTSTIWKLGGDYSFRSYLKHIFLTKKELNQKTRKEYQVVGACDAPSSTSEALERWEKTREDFLSNLSKIEGQIKFLEDFHNLDDLILQKMQQIDCQEKELLDEDTLKNKVKNEITVIKAKFIDLSLYTSKIEQVRECLSHHERLEPGFFAKLFETKRYRKWVLEYEEYLSQKSQAEVEWEKASKTNQVLKKQVCDLEAKADNLVSKKEEIRKEIEVLKEDLVKLLQKKEARRTHPAFIVYDEFWNKDDFDIKTCSPSLDTMTHSMRDKLFVQSFKVFKAFIDASAREIYHNLSIYFHHGVGFSFSSKVDPFRSHLLTTLTFFVPMISSAFASMKKLLGPLPRNSIGWLFIDEAGQATPQAAVGALHKVKKSLIVGDPKQIPPVETTSDALVKGIFKECGASYNDWAAPVASIQTLADRAVRFGCQVEIEGVEEWFGMPLLVHRRCANPMFNIVNDMSYGGTMVLARGASKECSFSKIFGSNAIWLDVDSQASDLKYNDIEMIVATSIISAFLKHRQIFSTPERSGNKRQIYTISPYKSVADEGKRFISGKLAKSSNVSRDEVRRSIGTVHTFQGAEADTVILLLGHPAREGSINWATQTANNLNVAVSRAKENFIVIGNWNRWADSHNMSYISDRTKRVKHEEIKQLLTSLHEYAW